MNFMLDEVMLVFSFIDDLVVVVVVFWYLGKKM